MVLNSWNRQYWFGTLLSFTAVAFTTTAGASNLEKCEDAYFFSGEPLVALEACQHLVDSSDALTSEKVWGYYYSGKIRMEVLGDPENSTKAFEYMELAANEGNVRAQYELGTWYLTGTAHLPEDRSKGMQWLRRAAIEHGDAPAMYLLGRLLLRPGESQDLSGGYEWLRRAAELEYVPSMESLASFLFIRRRTNEALDWYCRAAWLGSEEARLNVGRLHSVSSDDSEAFFKSRVKILVIGMVQEELYQLDSGLSEYTQDSDFLRAVMDNAESEFKSLSGTNNQLDKEKFLSFCQIL